MRKRTIFGIIMLLLVLSTSLMPVVKATTYVWDSVHFVEGYEDEWIKYPHPDRTYYGISPYSTESVDGDLLHHCQIDSATSITIVAAVDILCAALGAYVGGKIGGLWGAVAGAVVGGAFAVIITYVSEVYFLDEHNCIWWWLSLAFMNWVAAYAYTLWYYGATNPGYAIALVLSALATMGYIRVGALTFLDAIGAGNPSDPSALYSLTINVGMGGTTSPSEGTHEYAAGCLVTVTAYPYSTFQFLHWSLDGTIIEVNPITVTMDSDHTLYAQFQGGGGAGCPILSVFNGSKYVQEGLLDIHNPDGIDVFRNHTLTTTPQPMQNAYLLRLTEHPQTHSYIDQVKLYATLEDGTTIQRPLVSAVHSEYGNVLPQLLGSDDIRKDTSANQTIDLKFVALQPQMEIVSFIFQIEGNNPWTKE